MKDTDYRELVVEKLKWLRLPGMARTLAPLLDQANRENLSSLEVISRLADEEKASRIEECSGSESPRRPVPRNQQGVDPRAQLMQVLG